MPTLLAPPVGPVVEAATRREFLAVLGAAGLLAGCGTAGPPVIDPAPARTVEHALGETTLSGTPQRVVSLTDNLDLELLLMLDLSPVQVGLRADALKPWHTEAFARLGGSPQLLDISTFDVDLERIALAAPDLIVGQANILEESYRELSGLAPTLPTDPEDFRAGLATLGVLLGREDRAAELVAGYDRDLVDAQARIDLSGTTLGLVSAGYTDGFLNVFGTGGSQGKLLGSFGAGNVAPRESLTDLSPERLAVLAPADVIVILDYASDGDDPTTSPLFAGLPAVAAGRVARLTETQSYSLTLTNPLRLPTAVAAIGQIADTRETR